MPALAALLVTVEGVEWDAGITAKKVLEDEKHSAAERRFLRFGRTGSDRLLTAAFTVRRTLIRIISVRDMSRLERRRYVEAH